MTRKRADKFVGKKVRIVFTHEWFNEATQSWVNEDGEHIGVLNHCGNPTQRHLYQLDSILWLPTDNACWSENRMKIIEEL